MCNHQTTYLACTSTNKPENAQMCTFEHFITHVHILNIYTHICTTMQICTYMHDVHSGTNTPHAWLISVRRVSNISGASDGPPQLPKSDFGKVKLLAPLLLLVSEMTSHRSDFIIVSFRLVGTLLSWSWLACSSVCCWLLMPRSTGPKES